MLPTQPFVLDWLVRHDLDNLWDGIHFIGAFQFVTEVKEKPEESSGLPEVPGDGKSDASDIERRLKEAYLKNADKNGKVAVSDTSHLTWRIGIPR